jgi:hypothetical protein
MATPEDKQAALNVIAAAADAAIPQTSSPNCSISPVSATSASGQEKVPEKQGVLKKVKSMFSKDTSGQVQEQARSNSDAMKPSNRRDIKKSKALKRAWIKLHPLIPSHGAYGRYYQ